MTVLPFAARARRSDVVAARLSVAEVTGSFTSPSGRAGVFAGSYRLERLVRQHGQLFALGVFTGRLIDADGTRIGMGARRRTVAVAAAVSGPLLQVRLGRPDVDLLGFRVVLDDVTVDVPDTSDAGEAMTCRR